MPALVQLVVGNGQPTTVRLPDVPRPGELIALPDGRHVVVRSLEPAQGDVVAIVTATVSRWEPSRDSGPHH